MKQIEIIAIPPEEPELAKQRFRDWVDANQALLSNVPDQHVFLDVIRSKGGRTLHRYRVILTIARLSGQ